jgi:membrane associated rhomboid family serine protease
MIPIRDANPTGRPPFLTLVLIAINAGLFLLVWGEGPEAFQESIQTLGLIPALWIEEGFPLEPVLTSMFMHGSWTHLIGNMWYLWIFADNVEDKLGPWRFLLLYFLSGVGAVVFQVLSRPDSMVPMVGASGAISGVLGAYLVFFPQARVLVWWPLFYFGTLPAGLFIGLWFLIQFLSGSYQSLRENADVGGVAYWAHVGGFIVGWLLGLLWRSEVRQGGRGRFVI